MWIVEDWGSGSKPHPLNRLHGTVASASLDSGAGNTPTVSRFVTSLLGYQERDVPLSVVSGCRRCPAVERERFNCEY